MGRGKPHESTRLSWSSSTRPQRHEGPCGIVEGGIADGQTREVFGGGTLPAPLFVSTGARAPNENPSPMDPCCNLFSMHCQRLLLHHSFSITSPSGHCCFCCHGREFTSQDFKAGFERSYPSPRRHHRRPYSDTRSKDGGPSDCQLGLPTRYIIFLGAEKQWRFERGNT